MMLCPHALLEEDEESFIGRSATLHAYALA